MDQQSAERAKELGKSAADKARKGFGVAGDQIRDIVLSRKGVLAVRVDSDSLERIDALVEVGVVKSRSEAAHSLIKAGIEARSELFDKLTAEREETLRRKEELQQML